VSSRRRRHRFAGLLPRLGRGFGALGRRLWRYPQPVIGALIVGLALWALWGYAQRADAFRITQVHLPADPPFELRRPLEGANLWGVDLDAVAEQLWRQHPSLKDVRVVRQLPNAIRVTAIRRIPAAQVRLHPADGGAGRWYPVDREGFVLPEGTAEPADRLVRVVGFQRAGIALTPGHANDHERLQLALKVLQKLQRSPMGLWRRVTELDVADAAQLTFVLDDETEIRCGSEAELDTQLIRLRAALKAMARQPVKARYIDVRFQDPVMAPAAS
jgi:cell division septal protein FtsQ